MPKNKTSKKRATSKRKNSGWTAELRNIQRSIATLKRLGLAFQKTNARKKPKVSSRQKKIIKEFSDVLVGKPQKFHLSKKEAERFREAGYRMVGNSVVLSSERNSKFVKEGSKIFITQPLKDGSFIQSEVIPVKTTRRMKMREFLDDLIASDEGLGEDENYAFYFHGGLSKFKTFQTMQQLVEHLETYDEIMAALAGNDALAEDAIAHFTKIKVSSSFDVTTVERVRSTHKRSNPAYDADYYYRLKTRYPQRYEEKKAKANARAKAYYAKKASDPAFREMRRLASKAYRDQGK